MRTAVVGLIASLCLGTFGQVGFAVFADGAGNLPAGYVATDSLTSEDKFNLSQKNGNVQIDQDNGSSLVKTAEWTNKEAGEGKITMQYKAPESEDLNTAVFIFGTCNAHSFSPAMAKSQILELLEHYDRVDCITTYVRKTDANDSGYLTSEASMIANARKTSVSLWKKDGDANKAKIDELVSPTSDTYSCFVNGVHWTGTMALRYLQEYLHDNNPAAIYISFDGNRAYQNDCIYSDGHSVGVESAAYALYGHSCAELNASGSYSMFDIDDATMETLAEYQEQGRYYVCISNEEYPGQTASYPFSTLNVCNYYANQKSSVLLAYYSVAAFAPYYFVHHNDELRDYFANAKVQNYSYFTKELPNAKSIINYGATFGSQGTSFITKNLSISDTLATGLSYSKNDITVKTVDKNGNVITPQPAITVSCEGQKIHIEIPAIKSEETVTVEIPFTCEESFTSDDGDFADTNIGPAVAELSRENPLSVSSPKLYKHTVPEIPSPTKTVSKGDVVEKDLHNVVDYQGSYQYDVCQTIPAEDKLDYFKSFTMSDTFPAGVKVDSWKVFADGKDVTSKWKITKTTANENDEDNRQDTIAAIYAGDYNNASMYGVTYDFQFQVTETKEIANKEVLSNAASASIVYQNAENHYLVNDDGTVQKDANGNLSYECRPAEASAGSAGRTTEATQAEHYAQSNGTQTDVCPKFGLSLWDVAQNVYNEDGEEINTWAVHNGDTVTYKITLHNRAKRMSGKIAVTNPLPENVTFVDADNGGQYDPATGNIVWGSLPFEAQKTYELTFRVKVADAGSFLFASQATAVAKSTGGRASTQRQTETVYNYVPEIRKIVTDKDGNNINEALISKDSELIYHLYVNNPDTEKSHTFTITDRIPENTILTGISESGQTISALPDITAKKVSNSQSFTAGNSSSQYVSWTEELKPGEMKEYTFRVKADAKDASISNQAAFALHNTPKGDPDADRPSDTTYPLVPGKRGDSDDPEYSSNIVDNSVPADPVKEVQTLSGGNVDKDLLQAGDSYQYVITVKNSSKYRQSYTVTDTVPDHTELIKAFEDKTTVLKGNTEAAKDAANTVSVSGRNITWTADLLPGETKQFVFTFKAVDKDAHWSNKAHVTIASTVPGSDQKHLMEQDSNEVESWTPADPVKSVSATPNESDGSVDMNHAFLFGENADTLTYKISFRNNTTERKMYAIQDTLDTDLDFVKASDGGTYNEADRMIIWKIRLNPGESKAVTFDAKVNSGNRAASINNFAQMLVDQAYPISNTTDTDINETPTKTVTDKDGKAVDDFLVNKGDELAYTIRVHNSGKQEKHFTVYDEVPEGTELIEALPGVKATTDRFGEEVLSQDIPKTSTVETAQSRTKIAWEADIPAGETWAFRFSIKTAKKDSYIPNEAKVTAGHTSVHTNLVENWVPGDPLKAVTEDGKDVNKKAFFKEDRSKITYEITAKNPSNIDKSYTITDDLDKNLIFLSADNDGQYDKESGKVTWQVKIAAGETVTVKVETQFVAEPTAEKITNTADIACDNWHNVTNTVENYITYAPVKKVLTKSDADLSGKLIFADNEYKYTITWKNPTEEAHTYNITDVLPDSVTFVSADNNGKANGQAVSWNGISVEPGQTGTVSIVVKADLSIENKQIDNKACIKDANEENQYAHDTNVATVYTSQLKKTVTDKDDYGLYGYLVSPGDTILYHIKVENPSKVSQTMTVTDKLPKGVSYVSSDGKENNGMVTFENVSIPAGGKDLVITAKVTSEAKALDSIENVAHGSIKGTELDSNKVINYVFQEPVKTVVTTEDKKDVDGKTVKPEAALTYSVTFKNTSDKPQDFTATDKVDARLAVQKINDGGKMGKDNTITWVATLQAGESKTVTFEANAPKSAKQEEIENEVVVSVDKTSQKTNKVTVKVTPSADPTAVDKVKKAVQKVNVRATGDASNMTAWFVMGAAALAAGVAFILVKKKKNN